MTQNTYESDPLATDPLDDLLDADDVEQESEGAEPSQQQEGEEQEQGALAPTRKGAAKSRTRSESGLKGTTPEEGVRRERSTAGKFSWKHFSSVVAFTMVFTAAREDQRDYALRVFGVEASPGQSPADTVLDLLQKLLPAGGTTLAWRTYSSLVNKISQGTPSFADGIALVQSLNAVGAPVVKTFVELVNDASGGNLEIKRNASNYDIAQQALVALSETSDGVDAETLSFIDELIVLWPGEL